MEDIFIKLERYGVDLDNTMERFLDDKDLYKELLEDFINEDAISKLEQAIAEKDVTKAFEIAHTLKGTSGNMGLTPIYDSLTSLVEELRAGSLTNADQMVKKIRQNYDALLAICK